MNFQDTRCFRFYEKYMIIMGVGGQLLFYMQAIKIFTTKSASDISMLGFTLGLISVSSWLLYGIFLKNKVLVIANIFAVIGALLTVVGALLYRN